MGRNVFETIVGAVVLLVAAGFLYIAYSSGQLGAPSDGTVLTARFDRVDGLSVGGDVRVSGLKVGTITEQHIDLKTYQAEVVMSIDSGLKLPKDSTAEIIGDGLLGGKYLALIPGGSDEYLTSGGRITFTQSSISLESLIGKFMFGGSEKNVGDEDAKDEDDIF